MSVLSKLNRLKEIKLKLKEVISNKLGYDIGDNFTTYADKIKEIQSLNQLYEIIVKSSNPNFMNGYYLNALEKIEKIDDLTYSCFLKGTHIHNDLFFDLKIDSVIIPEGIETIGDRTFAWNNITNIDFPESLVAIGNNAFGDDPILNVDLKNVLTVGTGSFNLLDGGSAKIHNVRYMYTDSFNRDTRRSTSLYLMNTLPQFFDEDEWIIDNTTVYTPLKFKEELENWWTPWYNLEEIIYDYTIIKFKELKLSFLQNTSCPAKSTHIFGYFDCMYEIYDNYSKELLDNFMLESISIYCNDFGQNLTLEDRTVEAIFEYKGLKYVLNITQRAMRVGTYSVILGSDWQISLKNPDPERFDAYETIPSTKNAKKLQLNVSNYSLFYVYLREESEYPNSNYVFANTLDFSNAIVGNTYKQGSTRGYSSYDYEDIYYDAYELVRYGEISNSLHKITIYHYGTDPDSKGYVLIEKNQWS